MLAPLPIRTDHDAAGLARSVRKSGRAEAADAGLFTLGLFILRAVTRPQTSKDPCVGREGPT
jgi:hypothetical protein